jgi:hypothetical protein
MQDDASALKAVGIAALCAGLASLPCGALAQPRFDVLGQRPVAAAGVLVYTIRDRVEAVCYRLFVLASPDAKPPAASVHEPDRVATAEQLDRIRVANALKEAMAARDRKLADLGPRGTTSWTLEYESERHRIVDEYERVVRGMLPDLHPASQIAPGWRTTGEDALNDAVRRAIADADAAIAAASRSELDERLRRLLSVAAQSAEVTVSGPVACPVVIK